MSEFVKCNSERARRRQHPTVKARQGDALLEPAQILNRSQMQRVERTHRDRKWLQGARQDQLAQLDELDAAEELLRILVVYARKLVGMNSIPHLVFEESARCERFIPD